MKDQLKEMLIEGFEIKQCSDVFNIDLSENGISPKELIKYSSHYKHKTPRIFVNNQTAGSKDRSFKRQSIPKEDYVLEKRKLAFSDEDDNNSIDDMKENLSSAKKECLMKSPSVGRSNKRKAQAGKRNSGMKENSGVKKQNKSSLSKCQEFLKNNTNNTKKVKGVDSDVDFSMINQAKPNILSMLVKDGGSHMNLRESISNNTNTNTNPIQQIYTEDQLLPSNNQSCQKNLMSGQKVVTQNFDQDSLSQIYEATPRKNCSYRNGSSSKQSSKNSNESKSSNNNRRSAKRGESIYNSNGSNNSDMLEDDCRVIQLSNIEEITPDVEEITTSIINNLTKSQFTENRKGLEHSSKKKATQKNNNNEDLVSEPVVQQKSEPIMQQKSILTNSNYKNNNRDIGIIEEIMVEDSPEPTKKRKSTKKTTSSNKKSSGSKSSRKKINCSSEIKGSGKSKTTTVVVNSNEHSEKDLTSEENQEVNQQVSASSENQYQNIVNVEINTDNNIKCGVSVSYVSDSIKEELSVVVDGTEVNKVVNSLIEKTAKDRMEFQEMMEEEKLDEDMLNTSMPLIIVPANSTRFIENGLSEKNNANFDSLDNGEHSPGKFYDYKGIENMDLENECLNLLQDTEDLVIDDCVGDEILECDKKTVLEEDFDDLLALKDNTELALDCETGLEGETIDKRLNDTTDNNSELLLNENLGEFVELEQEKELGLEIETQEEEFIEETKEVSEKQDQENPSEDEILPFAGTEAKLESPKTSLTKLVQVMLFEKLDTEIDSSIPPNPENPPVVFLSPEKITEALSVPLSAEKISQHTLELLTKNTPAKRKGAFLRKSSIDVITQEAYEKYYSLQIEENYVYFEFGDQMRATPDYIDFELHEMSDRDAAQVLLQKIEEEKMNGGYQISQKEQVVSCINDVLIKNIKENFPTKYFYNQKIVEDKIQRSRSITPIKLTPIRLNSYDNIDSQFIANKSQKSSNQSSKKHSSSKKNLGFQQVGVFNKDYSLLQSNFDKKSDKSYSGIKKSNQKDSNVKSKFSESKASRMDEEEEFLHSKKDLALNGSTPNKNFDMKIEVIIGDKFAEEFDEIEYELSCKSNFGLDQPEQQDYTSRLKICDNEIEGNCDDKIINEFDEEEQFIFDNDKIENELSVSEKPQDSKIYENESVANCSEVNELYDQYSHSNPFNIDDRNLATWEMNFNDNDEELVQVPQLQKKYSGDDICDQNSLKSENQNSPGDKNSHGLQRHGSLVIPQENPQILTEEQIDQTLQKHDPEDALKRKSYYTKYYYHEASTKSPPKLHQQMNLFPLGYPLPDFTGVLLARKWDIGLDPSGWFMSEKLDGVRCLWTGNNLYSRNGTLIKAPKFFMKDFPKSPLDGELYIAKNSYEECVQTVQNGEEDHHGWLRMSFVVLDAPAIKTPFKQRQEVIFLYITNIGN